MPGIFPSRELLAKIHGQFSQYDHICRFLSKCTQIPAQCYVLDSLFMLHMRRNIVQTAYHPSPDQEVSPLDYHQIRKCPPSTITRSGSVPFDTGKYTARVPPMNQIGKCPPSTPGCAFSSTCASETNSGDFVHLYINIAMVGVLTIHISESISASFCQIITLRHG